MIWPSDDDTGSGGVPGVSGCCGLPAEPCPEAVSPGFCLNPKALCGEERGVWTGGTASGSC